MNVKKMITMLLAGVFVVSGALQAGTITDSFKDYFKDKPYLGTLADEVTFDGIEISQLHFPNGKKYYVAKPNEKIMVKTHYKIDADQLSSLHMHHFIFGLHPKGPQNCFLHSVGGMLNAEGNTQFELTAPKEKGIYELRFCHSTGLSYNEAKAAWWHRSDQKNKGASADTVMGVVLVQ